MRLQEQRLRQAVQGKSILITGASSGIGRDVALLLARYEANLIIVGRDEERLRDVAVKTGARMYRMDLREEENRRQLCKEIGQLDIFINNAGLSIHRSIYDSLERSHDFSRTMAINYFAPVELMLHFIPLLDAAKGQVVNVSTINTKFRPMAKWSAYQASKAAFDTWLRAVAPEVKHTVSTIYLPLVRTPMIAPTKKYKHVPAMASEVAAQRIARLLYTKKKEDKPWWLPFLHYLRP
ncbi:SDR family NAD(P)-dependent oxidoreductase [Metasolibacillus sp. FSL H7-0170]|uniref:SDR family NAD(P)-dependent oxidoreductase n=1 Tax=Metasolibacillus TaxID=2703677 RepID=UPI000D3DC971|nr:SDR family NAD(P)-dependent oxidoreductase [Metasolibacillus fluoroglycofenilyticus]